MDKVVVVIDGGYFAALNRYLEEERGKRLDVEKFTKKLTNGMYHIRTKFYYSNPYKSKEPTETELERFRNAQRFQYAINRIRNHDFMVVGRVRQVHVHCQECDQDYTTPKQKGVDVGLALDLVAMARKKVANLFILVSGDEDFSRAVEMAQEELANVVIYFSSDSDFGIYGSQKLSSVASDRFRMDLDFLEECSF